MNGHTEGVEISAFLDGALDAPDLERARAHLASCASCSAELDSLRFMKRTLSAAPRRTMPAELALALEHRLAGFPRRRWASRPAFWIPAGALAAAALSVGLFFRQARSADELPLEPFLAAHARYSAEGLVQSDRMVAGANYSDLASADASDVELE